MGFQAYHTDTILVMSMESDPLECAIRMVGSHAKGFDIRWAMSFAFLIYTGCNRGRRDVFGLDYGHSCAVRSGFRWIAGST